MQGVIDTARGGRRVASMAADIFPPIMRTPGAAVPGVQLTSEAYPVDRRQQIVTLDDGRIVDENAMREWLAAMDRRNERVTVARLSETDEATLCVYGDGRCNHRSISDCVRSLKRGSRS